MGSLFYSGLGRIAPLSNTITGVPVHFVQGLKIYVRCGGQNGCLLCQNNFKVDTRSGIWVLDYDEKDAKYLIKVFSTVSENLTRVMHAIARESGLQNSDWIIEKSSNGRGIFIRKQDGLPLWYQSARDHIAKIWEPYKIKDLSKLLARPLTPEEMQQVLAGTYNKDRRAGNQASGPGNAQASGPVGSVLGGGSSPNPGQSAPQGWTPPAGSPPQQNRTQPNPGQPASQPGWTPPTGNPQQAQNGSGGSSAAVVPPHDPLKGLL